MKKLCVIILLSLSGCSAYFRDIEIEKDCYEPFDQKVSEFFHQSQNGDVFVWEVPEGYVDAEFFKKNYIQGNLIPDNYTSSNVIISAQSNIKLTGRIFKFWPSWAEYHIGGGRKNIQLEASINGKNYLIFDSYIPKTLKESIINRCKFN